MAELIPSTVQVTGVLGASTAGECCFHPGWASSAVLWPLVVVPSAVILIIGCIRCPRTTLPDKPDSGDEASARYRVPIFWDLLQQGVRALLLGLTVASCAKKLSSTWAEVPAVAYMLGLDLWRATLPRYSSFRFSLLHHANVINVVQVLAGLAQILPYMLLVETHYRASSWVCAKVAVSVVNLLIAFATPRQWVPARLGFWLAHRDETEPSPEQTCSYLSYYVTYSWLSKLINVGAKRRLVLGDLLPLPDYDEPLVWRERIHEARARFKSTTKTLAFTLRHNIGMMAFLAASTAVVEFVAPLALYQLLSYLQDRSAAAVQPWLWVVLLFTGPMLRSVVYQQYIFWATRLAVRIKLCLVQELFAKAGRSFDTSALDSTTHEKGDSKAGPREMKNDKSGHKSENITNLMAYDVDAIWGSRDFILVSIASPIEITIGIIFLYRLFGPCALVALAVMLCSFPLAAVLSQTISYFQRQLMARTDSRISTITECLSSIRIIKYLGWEPVMAARINAKRHEEEKLTWKRNLLSVAVAVSGDFIPLFALLSMFATYTLVLGHPLSGAKAFTSVSIIETLRLQFVWIANVTRFYSQGRIALGRIDRYMNGEPEVAGHGEGPPRFSNAVFRCALTEDSFRINVDVDFVDGGLNVITGASGSGKSTLLLSLLGETVLESGSATCPKDISYASQIPWLLDDTIRENIVLYEPFDQERYDRVIFACGLVPDLEKFADGDLKTVGISGCNLSGGQRQRVCLARALYGRSELVLLDDAFSALDSTTQKHVWEHCFREDVLQGRTVILVTQMQAAKDAADLLIELSHGQIVSRHQQRASRQETEPLPTQPPSFRSMRLTGSIADLSDHSFAKKVEAKINSEIADQKRNPRTLFYEYMYLFGGHPQAMLSFMLCLLVQLAFFSLPLWLAVWIGASSSDHHGSDGPYVAKYALILVLFSLLQALNHLYIQWGAWRVAHYIHESLVSAALGVSVHWFDKNPPGRFINRFSSDMYSLDSVLMDYLRIAVDNVFRFLLRLTAIGSIMPIFGIPAAVVCAFGFVCAEMYTRAQLSVRSLVSAAQSPIFSFFLESMPGRPVIRSRAGMQQAFADTLARRLRVYARVAETQYNLNRWISVRADGCAAVIALATGVIAVTYGSTIPPGNLGFSLTSAIGLGQTILNLVRNSNELEVELNSFYRAREYANLPHEGSDAGDETSGRRNLPDSWPAQASIEFRNATVKYALDGPEILHGVSLSIAPGQRVAVVGRTGSGKSTMALSLLSFTNVTKGSILVDGIDLASVPPQELRQRFTIIPQEPVLFAGDIRFNLDPSQTSPESRLVHAIEACSVIESFGRRTPRDGSPDEISSRGEERAPSLKRFDLDTVVAPQGANFSVGQRQAVSVARAAVRQSKLVILDEATASIDYQSEVAIQEVLRTAFSGSTVLAIVHKLSTILDYDNVVVMDAGRICEMGAPKELYEQGGSFHQMVNQSIHQGRGGEWTAEKLMLLGLTPKHGIVTETTSDHHYSN